MTGRGTRTYLRTTLTGEGRQASMRRPGATTIKPNSRSSRVQERGASLSMALLFILVAATVGFIIVTAATVLTGRAATTGNRTRELADQRQYLLRSAARLVRDELVGEHGSYVCLESDSIGGTPTYYLSAGLLDSSDTPQFVRGGEAVRPSTLLQYLVWQKVTMLDPDTIPTVNQWVGPDSDVASADGLYHRDVLISLTGDGTFENWAAGFNDLTDTTVELLCRLTADADLNITAEIGYFEGTSSNVNTMMDSGYGFDDEYETITLTFPATRTDFPSETSTNPETNVTTIINRYLYVWGRD